MNQNTSVLSDSSALEEVPRLLESGRQQLSGVVAHGNTQVREIWILLVKIANPSDFTRRRAVEDILDIMSPQGHRITRVFGVANPDPVELLVPQIAHGLVLADNLGSCILALGLLLLLCFLLLGRLVITFRVGLLF